MCSLFVCKRKKGHSLVKALQLPILSVQIRMEEQPVMLMQFTLKMPRSYQMMSSLNALPVSVEVNETREVESTMENQ
ncbi:unnamed protein product [Caenorhabditis nigoni]